jgi:hypothetical protein
MTVVESPLTLNEMFANLDSHREGCGENCVCKCFVAKVWE